MPEIKHIGPESSKLLAELCVNTFMQAYEGVHSWENLERYCRKNHSERNMREVLSQVDTLAKIAYANSQPSGFYILKHHACPLEQTVHATELKQIYVLSGYYGTGLGKKLFDDVLEQTVGNGSELLWLCVSDINYQALAFYKRLGFTRIGDGPTLEVGSDCLPSSIMGLEV